jgi:arylsulfatase A-like enzyme
MSPNRNEEPLRLDVVLVLAGAVATLRAVLIAVADGYASKGLARLSIDSFSWRWLAGFGLAWASFLVLAFWRRARGGGGPFFVAFVVTWLMLALRWPALPLAAPGWVGARAWIAHGVALAAAFATATVLARAPRVGHRSFRFLARATWLLLFLAIGARAFVRFTGGATKERPNVLVIAIDSLRADRVGVLGGDERTTPAIDRFARDAVRFERAYSPTSSTIAAHGTILTGLEPMTHGITSTTALPADARTLPAILRENGFATVAQVDDVAWFHPRFGLERGFDVYHRFPGDAFEKIDALEPLWDDLERERFFLYLHFNDPCADERRSPYDADVRDLNAFASDLRGEFSPCDDLGRCGARWLRARGEDANALDADTLAQIRARYDAGVRGLDRALARLFDVLERRGFLDNTLVVLTASHGEALFEHGRGLHQDLQRECTAVPLIVRPPGGVEPRSLTRLVALSDVAPTVLDLVGLSRAPAEMQGRSIAELVRGANECPRGPFVFQSDGGERFALRTERWTLIDTRDGRLLYDARSDPFETEPRTDPKVEGVLRDLGLVLDRAQKSARAMALRIGTPEPVKPFAPAETRRLWLMGELHLADSP